MSNATTTATAPAISTLEGAGNISMQTFNSAEFGTLRGAEINGEPWFVGKDVAKALGYANTKDAIISHISDEDKRLLQRSDFATFENHPPKDVSPANFVPGDIPNRGLMFINESGFYSLVLCSKLKNEKVRAFKHWVTYEVLPSIRKHGAYMTPQAVEQVLQDPDFIIRLATNLKDEQQKRKEAEGQVLQLTAKVTALKPKADYCDLILASDTAVTITQIAADYNMSAKAMNLKLHDLGIQWKVNGQWILYTEFMDKGYTRSSTIHLYQSDGRERTKMNTLWTQKGRLFLYDKLKAAGVLPLMEQ